MTAALKQNYHSFNMASFSSTPLFDWGINLSYEEHVDRHVPSGEHNGLIASIIMAERRGDTFIKMSSDTPFDLPLCVAQNLVKEKEVAEKRLLAAIQKVKDELSHHAVNSSHEEDEDEDEEEAEEPEVKVRGVQQEKSLKDPKKAQKLLTQKQRAEEARKRKGLLSSLKTQSESLAELRKEISEQRATLSKQESLQKLCRLLNKGLLGAQRSYSETHDQEFLVKNVHHNMAVWAEKSEPPKMVGRLIGSPGSFKTVMVPENQRAIVPLSEFLREDW